MNQHFLDTQLFPAAFAEAERLLPEFEFRRKGSNWVSTNRLKVTGEEGDAKGIVQYWERAPYCLVDFTRGTVGLIDYVIDAPQHPLASDFVSAVQYLADQLGLRLPEREMTPEQRRKREANELHTQIWSEVHRSCRAALTRQLEQGGAVAQYLQGRDIATDNPAYEPLGAVPDLAELQHSLLHAGFSEAQIRAHVKLPSGVGKSHLLSIAWRDPVGRVQGMTFRSLGEPPENRPKYLNNKALHPDAPSFKSQLVFNLRQIRRGEEAILVEGPLDALQCEAAGIANVVAVGGGGKLSDTQLQHLTRANVRRITLAFDNDKAGVHLTRRALEQLRALNYRQQADIALYVLDYTGFASGVQQSGVGASGVKDPGEWLQQNGVQHFESALQAAPLAIVWELQELAFEHLGGLFPTDKLTHKQAQDLLEAAATVMLQINSPHALARARQWFDERREQFEDHLGFPLETFDQLAERKRDEQAHQHYKRELRNLLARTDELLRQDQPEAAEELLRTRGATIREQQQSSHFARQLQPVSREQLTERLQAAPTDLETDFNFDGEPLRLPAAALSILAAPTSHGKTLFLLNLILQAVERYPERNFVFFSYEESAEAILIKAFNTWLGRELGRNNRRALRAYFRSGDVSLLSGNISTADLSAAVDQFFRTYIDTGRLRIHYVDYTAPTLTDALRYLQRNAPIGGVFVDYMQLLRQGGGRFGSRQEELKQVCLDLKDAAVQTGLPLVIAAQFNRQVISEAHLSPVYIGEAGDIERIANLIVGFWNRNFPGFSPEGNRTKDGRPVDPAPELYCEILKGRDIGAGASTVLSINGNTGRLSAPEPKRRPPKRVKSEPGAEDDSALMF